MCGLTRKSDKLIETDPLFSLVMYERKPRENMTIILCDVRDGMWELFETKSGVDRVTFVRCSQLVE